MWNTRALAGRALVAVVFLLLTTSGTSHARSPRDEHAMSATGPRVRGPFPADLRAALLRALQERAPAEYALTPDGAGALGDNPTFDFSMRVEGGAVALRGADGARVGLELAGWGRPGAIRRAAIATTRHAGNRVTLEREDGLTEWYANGPFGVEQGFVVARRPEGRGALRFELAVDGASPREAADGQIQLVDGRGRERWRYGELAVYDADGRRVPARTRADGHRVVLEIDDADARYPLDVDPFLFRDNLWLALAVPDDQFGLSVDIYGEAVGRVAAGVAVVGAPAWAGQGRAFVFERTATDAWDFAAELSADRRDANDRFGADVAIGRLRVVVGAPGDDDRGVDAGAVYVFERELGDPPSWVQADKLFASDARADDQLGTAVDLDGGLLAASALNGGGISRCGTAYAFRRGASGWGQTELDASHRICTLSGGTYGTSIAAHGWTVVVGASTPFDGSVYVWTSDIRDVWTLEAHYEPEAPGGDVDVAVTGDPDAPATRAVVGLPGGGVVDILERAADATWSRVQELRPTSPPPSAAFGYAVAASGDRVIVGAPLWGADAAGRVLSFIRAETGEWREQQPVRDSGLSADSVAGWSVALDGSLAVVGVPGVSAATVSEYEDTCAGSPEDVGPRRGCHGYVTPDQPAGSIGAVCELGVAGCDGIGATCVEAVDGSRGVCALPCDPGAAFVSTGSCPTGSRCLSTGGGAGRCMAACQNDEDCPSGHCGVDGSCLGPRPPELPDAGPPESPDAGAPPSGTDAGLPPESPDAGVDAGVDPGAMEGGCSVSRRAPTRGALFALVALGLFVMCRRGARLGRRRG